MWIHLPALSAFVYLVLIIYVAAREDPSKGKHLLLMLLVTSFTWPAFYYAKIMTETLEGMILITRIRFAVFPLVPLSICLLLVYLTGIGQKLPRWLWIYLLLMPVVLAILSLTSSLHRSFFDEFVLEERYGYSFLQLKEGPLFFSLFLTYAYVVSILNIGLMIIWYKNGRYWVRRQALLLIIASVLPAVFDLGRLVGWELIPGFNLAPATIGISGLLIVWAVVGYRLAQASPVARSMLLDSLPSIVVVLDDIHRIVDANSVACKALQRERHDLLMMMPDRLNTPWRDWLEPVRDVETERSHYLTTGIEGQPRYFERSVHPLYHRRRLIGTMICLDDVTRFREANLALAEQERLKEQASLLKDLHDGVGGLSANIGLLAQLALGGESDEAREAGLKGILGLAQEMGVEVRRFISLLEQPDYGWNDWMLEIRTFCKTALDGLPMDVHLQIGAIDDVRPLRSDVGLSVYRLIKECVTNVVKHAEATAIWITVGLTSEALFVEVRDNGCGFTGEPDRKGGLLNMRERVRKMGGEMETISKDGVTQRVTIPVRRLWRDTTKASEPSGER